VEPHDPAAAEPDFLELELALAERRSAAVVGGLAGLIDEAFVEVGASGRRWDRAAIHQLLAATKGVAVTIDDFDVAPLADGVRLVTYRATAGGRCGRRSGSAGAVAGGCASTRAPEPKPRVDGNATGSTVWGNALTSGPLARAARLDEARRLPGSPFARPAGSS
jgi:hypothetical protein